MNKCYTGIAISLNMLQKCGKVLHKRYTRNAVFGNFDGTLGPGRCQDVPGAPGSPLEARGAILVNISDAM